MNLLDILLTLVDEEQLRWDLLFIRAVSHLIIILFDGKVPERHLIVGTGRGKERVFRWMPFDRRDWGSMPIKRCHWCRIRAGRSTRVAEARVRSVFAFRHATMREKFTPVF